MRHRDRAAAAAVGVAVLGRRRQLGGGQAVAPVQVDHGSGERGMGADDVRELGLVHVDAEVAIHRDLSKFGDQSGVVVGREERGVDAEHLGDAKQHRDGQRAHVVLDLVEVARGDVEHLRQRGLAEAPFASKLAYPRSDEGLGHVRSITRLRRHTSQRWQFPGCGSITNREQQCSGQGLGDGPGQVDDARPRSAPRRVRRPVAAAGRRRRPRGPAEVRRRDSAHSGHRLGPVA